MAKAYEAADRARAEIKEAADSKEGLFDLPTNDAAGDSAIVKAGPRWYSESSPFVSADQQERHGLREDCHGRGSYGGFPYAGGGC